EDADGPAHRLGGAPLLRIQSVEDHMPTLEPPRDDRTGESVPPVWPKAPPIPRYRAAVSDESRLTIAYDEPDEDGWVVARVVEVPGAISQGRTQEEARENVIDASRLMLPPNELTREAP